MFRGSSGNVWNRKEKIRFRVQNKFFLHLRFTESRAGDGRELAILLKLNCYTLLDHSPNLQRVKGQTQYKPISANKVNSTLKVPIITLFCFIILFCCIMSFWSIQTFQIEISPITIYSIT